MKLITFSLFGNQEIYCKGAVENARLAQELYPGWVARFYIADDVPEAYIRQIAAHGAQVVRCERKNAYDGLLWRFRTLTEDDIEVWVSRDCDSRLSPREKAAVDEWLATNKSLHVMRDAYNHTYPIMAGMFGIQNTLFHTRYGKLDFENRPALTWHIFIFELTHITDCTTLRCYLRSFKHLALRLFGFANDRESDQTILEQTVWKMALHDHLCHDHWNNTVPAGRPTTQPGDTIFPDKAFGVGLVNYVTHKSLKPKGSYPEGQDSRPFPPHKPMVYGIYVGQRIDEYNQPIMNTDTRWEYELRGIGVPV
ncbi:MAG: hypothetical protein WAV50_00485 [Minisyncoccia bacterium]